MMVFPPFNWSLQALGGLSRPPLFRSRRQVALAVTGHRIFYTTSGQCSMNSVLLRFATIDRPASPATGPHTPQPCPVNCICSTITRSHGTPDYRQLAAARKTIERRAYAILASLLAKPEREMLVKAEPGANCVLVGL